MSMPRLRPLSLLASALLLAACGGGGDTAADSEMAADSAAAPAPAAEAAAEMMPMETFFVTMNGANERPDMVATNAMGEASLIMHGDSIAYAVNALEIKGITGVHIHRGGPEEAGPVLVSLMSNDAGVDPNNGSVVSGTITRETPISEGVTFDELKDLLKRGQAYINIHSTKHPGGELRGAVGGM